MEWTPRHRLARTVLGIALFAASALAQVPIKSLWLTSPQLLMPPYGPPMVDALKDWRQVFDAIMLVKLPPTFSDEQHFTEQANALIKAVGGKFVMVTLPVGTEGWESSANQRLAQRQASGHGHYDATKAMPQLQWLATLTDLDSDTWGWILEQPARMPTPDQAAQSAAEFVRYAKSRHKKTAIWLSGEALNHPQFKEMTQRVCDATRADADFFGWMDLPAESIKPGETQWRETLGGLLDQILTMTPKDKTIIQWSHNPNSPTKDIEGTKAYIGVCQAKGINRFCLLTNPQFLERAPWREFYRTLPKVPTL